MRRIAVFLLLCISQALPARSFYANVTLTSLGGDLAVTVYLPSGVEEASAGSTHPVFYQSSRFDHGSMIGSIRRKSRRLSEKSDGSISTNELYGTELWRTPHNPYWPESGVGLASEFGVGDDGANCDLRCGWNGINDVTNGLLGYQEALEGGSFLKIGVGELIKGSCPACDSTGVYRFNSPYEFAKKPQWSLTQPQPNVVVLQHEARLNQYGYRLEKKIVLEDNVLRVTSALTNLGAVPFRTAWYSHHFYNCDANPVGPGYTVDLNMRPSSDGRPLYEEPGLSGWTTPLANYAKVRAKDTSSIQVGLTRYVEEGTRIKAEFLKDRQSGGGFAIHGCGVAVREHVEEVTAAGTDLSMYGFNLYMEKTTLSPEPQILVNLRAGGTSSWTQQLVFEDDNVNLEGLPKLNLKKTLGTTTMVPSQLVDVTNDIGGIALVIVAICVAGLVVHKWLGGRRSAYTQIPS